MDDKTYFKQKRFLEKVKEKPNIFDTSQNPDPDPLPRQAVIENQEIPEIQEIQVQEVQEIVAPTGEAGKALARREWLKVSKQRLKKRGDHIVNMQGCADILCVSVRTLRYNLMKDKTFPEPFYIQSPLSTLAHRRWRASDILKWASKKKRGFPPKRLQ